MCNRKVVKANGLLGLYKGFWGTVMFRTFCGVSWLPASFSFDLNYEWGRSAHVMSLCFDTTLLYPKFLPRLMANHTSLCSALHFTRSILAPMSIVSPGSKRIHQAWTQCYQIFSVEDWLLPRCGPFLFLLMVYIHAFRVCILEYWH